MRFVVFETCLISKRMFPAYLFFLFSALAGLLTLIAAHPAGGDVGGGVQGASAPLPQQEAPSGISAPLKGAYTYLRKYGYIAREHPQASTLRRIEDYHSAIRSFQQFFGLPESGQMDPDTTRLMTLPRCGLPDVVESGDPGQSRVKRFAHSGAKWEKNDLTYRIINFTPDLRESQIVDAFERAFKVWSDVIPVTFTRVASGDADINIRFASEAHGDGFAFDGEGGTLAHAFYPGDNIGGDAHFDDDELFTIGSSDGTELFMVGAHEIGHSLGLGHSSHITSLMAPFYMGYDPNMVLSYDDLHGIQALYGVNPHLPEGATFRPLNPEEPHRPKPTPDPDSDPCSKSYNAVAFIRGEIFLFKGKNFWRMQVRGEPLEGYPIEIGKFWTGLQPKIDAAYERYDGKIVFFKGPAYWVYQGVAMESDYPRSTTELGLPERVDGALPWGRTGKTYFFRGEQYWRFDEFEQRVDPGYPKTIQDNWPGVPANIDAVFRHYDGYAWNTYFVRNRRYWMYDESRGEVDVGYPRDFAVDWMSCKPEEKEEEDEEGDGGDGEKGLPGQLRADKISATAPPSKTPKGGARRLSISTPLVLASLLLVPLFVLNTFNHVHGVP